MKKGRCSNSPDRCSYAKSGTLLPYAGVGSLCPECGSPLALVSVDDEASNNSPSQNSYNNRMGQNVPPSGQYRASGNYNDNKTYFDPYEARSNKREQRDSRNAQNVVYEDEYVRSGNGGEILKIGLIVAGIAGAIFFATKFVDSKKKNTESKTAAIQQELPAETPAPQVTEITPPQLGKTITASDILTSPDMNSAKITSIGQGVIIDITGQVNANGQNWYRVTTPNGTRTGFISASYLIPVNQDGIQITPDPTLGTNQVDNSGSMPAFGSSSNTVAKPHNYANNNSVKPAAPKIVISPTTPISSTILYVSTVNANIRNDAGANASKVDTLMRGDTVTAVATKTVNGAKWFKVKLPAGGTGWVAGSVVSSSKPSSASQLPDFSGANNNSSAPATNATKPSVIIPKLPSFEDDKPAAPKPAASSGGKNVFVNTVQANVRSSTEVSPNNIVSKVDKGSVLKVTETKSINGQTWYKVKSDRLGVNGWVAASTVHDLD